MPKSMHGIMTEFSKGQLHSGSTTGPVVRNRKQAIAIGMNEQRQQGKSVPPSMKALNRARGGTQKTTP